MTRTKRQNLTNYRDDESSGDSTDDEEIQHKTKKGKKTLRSKKR